MPTTISSMEKICQKPADQTETPLNQSTSQSSGHRGKDGQSNSSSSNGGRRRTRSNMLISPSEHRIPDSFQDSGSETLMPRRASSHLSKNTSRGLHEGDTIKKPISSPQMPTQVSRPPNIGLSYSSIDDEEYLSLDDSSIGEEAYSSICDEDEGIERGLHKSDIIKKPTSSPQMPTAVSRPPKIGLRTSYSSTESEDEGVKRGLRKGDVIKKPKSSSIIPTVVSRPSNIWLRTSSSSSDDEFEGAIRGLHEGNTKRKPTSSPVVPTIVSRPSNIGLGTSYSDSDDVGPVKIRMKMSDNGKTVSLRRLSKTEEQALEKMEPVTILRDLPQSEEQASEKMELVTILGELYIQEGLPQHNKIARALELIRTGVDLQTRIDGETALHLVVRICYSKKGGHVIQILHELLERGADVGAINSVDETALQTAIRFDLRDYDENGIEVVRQLLRYKADVNAKDRSSRTPLHFAAWLSCGECIDVLLAAGAQVDQLDLMGWMALHWAVSNKDQGQVVARKLILAGIDMDVTDNDGRTALDVARQYKHSGIIDVIEETQEQRRQSHWNE